MPYEQQFTDQLNDPTKEVRLDAVYSLCVLHDTGKLDWPAAGRDVNNHIHTTYSFSPYSPAKAAYMAKAAGLCTAGIVDHDSVNGVDEFMKAAAMLHLPAVSGFEVRTDLSHTPLANISMSNPDEPGSAYVTLQGLPHDRLDHINDLLAPFRSARRDRAQIMADRISDIMDDHGLPYSFEADVYPITMYDDGGTITERHLLYAMAAVLTEHIGRGQTLIDFLASDLKLNIPDSARKKLGCTDSPYYLYDLLGVLKSEFLPAVYERGGADCPPIELLRDMAASTGALLTYCYLGDQDESPTGDKRAAAHEDAHLDTLFPELCRLGFTAVAYMPTRNTDAQVARLKEYCRNYSMFEICGEDINQPRQQFICQKMREPLYADACDCTFALLASEYLVTEQGAQAGLAAQSDKPLPLRIAEYARIGHELCP